MRKQEINSMLSCSNQIKSITSMLIVALTSGVSRFDIYIYIYIHK